MVSASTNTLIRMAQQKAKSLKEPSAGVVCAQHNDMSSGLGLVLEMLIGIYEREDSPSLAPLVDDAAKRIADAAERASEAVARSEQLAAERVANAARQASDAVAAERVAANRTEQPQHDSEIGEVINRARFSFWGIKCNGISAVMATLAVIVLACVVFIARQQVGMNRLQSLMVSAHEAKGSAIEARLTQKDQTKTIDEIRKTQEGQTP